MELTTALANADLLDYEFQSKYMNVRQKDVYVHVYAVQIDMSCKQTRYRGVHKKCPESYEIEWDSRHFLWTTR